MLAGTVSSAFSNGQLDLDYTHSALAQVRITGGGRDPLIALPDLSAATWRFSAQSFEAKPSFDDAAWASATRTTTASTTPPPAGQPVLTADDYGFHHGDVWYRGRFTGAAASLSLHYGGGGAGMLQAWLDGVYLGQDLLATGTTTPTTTGTALLSVPAALRTGGAHVLSVMVRNGSHNEDGAAACRSRWSSHRDSDAGAVSCRG